MLVFAPGHFQGAGMTTAAQGIPARGNAEALLAAVAALRAEVGKRIVGQGEIVDEVLITLLAGGHALLIGVPGLAKTLLIRTVAEAMHLEFRRIQFTPDLVPSDITGTELLEEDAATGHRTFRFVRGPIFGNIILADEINRAPPRTQAALLEAMQEHRVTAAGDTMKLPQPFFVLATLGPARPVSPCHPDPLSGPRRRDLDSPRHHRAGGRRPRERGGRGAGAGPPGHGARCHGLGAAAALRGRAGAGHTSR